MNDLVRDKILLYNGELPIAGEVLASGKKIQRPEISRTLVFQDYALFPWLNVIENVAFGLKHKITDKDERFLIASRYLKMVGLLDSAKERHGKANDSVYISVGEKQARSGIKGERATKV